MPLLPAAIGIILNDTQTEIVLVKRRDVPVWVLPGGGVEEYETAEESVIREIEEETGFQVRVLRKCAEYSPINRLASFTSIFLCQIQSGHMRLSNEVSEIAFHPLNKLPSTLFHLHTGWLHEALTHSHLIQRSLTEVSYFALLKYLISHPGQVIRFAWTRFFKS